MSAPARLSRALSHAAPAAADALVLSYSLTCGRARPGQAAGASVNDPTPSATSTTRGAIVVAHGLLGNKTNWQTVVKGLALKTERDVYALDLRNHGASPRASAMSFGHMALDLARFLREELPLHGHDGRQAVCIGHSLGGKAMMELALAKLCPFAGLVVADIAPVTYAKQGSEVYSILSLVAKTDVSSYATRAEIDSALRAKVPSDVLRRFLLANIGRSDQTGKHYWRTNVDAVYRNVDDLFSFNDSRLRSHDGPVMFIRGSESSYVRDEDMPTIRALFPAARVVTLPGGHWIHAEATDKFVASVAQFATEL